jgi:hypothetical protein
MRRPADELKNLADEAARQISAGGGATAARILRMLHGTQTPPRPSDERHDAQRVGIWERTADGAFVRDMKRVREWHLWANIGRIPAKGTVRRVVLLGESVARGYLYDPAYTPATVLTKILESRLGQGAVEVVDLAQASIGTEITDVAVAAAALQPDVVVLFCGNNWHYTHPTDPLGAGVLGAVIGDRGVAGLKAHAEIVLRERAEQVVDEVSEHYAAAGVPVLWITPEFNLGDWQDPVIVAPHLPGDRNERWLTYRAAAHAALATGDREGAVRAALRMIDADQGTSAAGYAILARCGVGADGTDDARTALAAARDASCWDTAVSLTPRISATVLDVLRTRSLARGDLLVDSAALLHDHLDGELPDRRMFLDYCHLTSEGIRVTMAATAAVLLDVFGSGAATWRQLVPQAPRASAEVEAEAHFLAAVHNAHWWQDGGTVEHHIAESLRYSTHLAPLMTAFIEQQARRIPPMLSRAADTINDAGSEQIQRYLFRHDDQRLDPLISAAIVNGLSGVSPRPELRLDRLWREGHSPELGPVDLLDYYYLSAARQPHEVEWARRESRSRDRDYFKAFSPVSRFCFIGDADRPVVLDITWRIPHAAQAENDVLVRIGEYPVGHLRGGTAWSRHEITVPADLVSDGRNDVVLEWPSPAFPADEAIRVAAEAATAGETPDLYCSFGDVHTFTARSDNARP